MSQDETKKFSFSSMGRKAFVLAKADSSTQIERILSSLSIPIASRSEELFSLDDKSHLAVFDMGRRDHLTKGALTRSLKRIKNTHTLKVIYGDELGLRLDELLYFHALGVSYVACGPNRDDDIKKYLKSQLHSQHNSLPGFDRLKCELDDAIFHGDAKELRRLYSALKKFGKRLNFDLLFEKYRVCLAMNAHAKAVFYLRQALEHDRQSIVSFFEIANLFFQENSGKKALEEIDRTGDFGLCQEPLIVANSEHPFLALCDYEASPSVLKLLRVLGQISASLSRGSEAEFYFLAALLPVSRDYDERSICLFAYGKHCLDSRRFPEAKDLLLRCVKLERHEARPARQYLLDLDLVTRSFDVLPDELNLNFVDVSQV